MPAAKKRTKLRPADVLDKGKNHQQSSRKKDKTRPTSPQKRNSRKRRSTSAASTNKWKGGKCIEAAEGTGRIEGAN